MRLLAMILGALTLAQCASGGDDLFQVGRSAEALVIIGVAETADERDPRYSLLWRRVGPDGRFEAYDDARSIEARTHSRSSVRIEHIPGEFEILRVEPGIYALDSAYATLRESGLTYVAHGLVLGPDRPSFEVRAGEAVYLGIWEMDIDGARATARLWRLDEADLQAVASAARHRFSGGATLASFHQRSTPCEPRRMSRLTQRQVC